MNYGHDTHISSPEDLTILSCSSCGWHSGELSRDQMKELGVPLYCGRSGCGKKNVHFVVFHPVERAQAYDAAGIPLEEMPPTPQEEALADKLTQEQIIAVRAVLEKHALGWNNVLLEELCALLAEEFRKGVVMTQELYGLREKS